jgi:hypothetical protein
MDKKVKKFIIEVEEGRTVCDEHCPLYTDYGHCSGGIYDLDCHKHNLATMKIKEMEDSQCSET